MKFFKNGCNGRGRGGAWAWEIFTKIGGGGARNGKGGCGAGFIMGEWEIFKVSLHSWLKGANLVILWKTLILPTPPPSLFFFKFYPLPALTSLSSPPPLLFLLPCLFGWTGHQATTDVLFYLMILWISTWQDLVP